MDRKLLKVYSHPRSGTHFLEAFIANNFYQERNLSLSNVKWGHWSNRKIKKEGNPYGKLFGHHFFPTISNFKAPGIYIIRDGRAVAYSIWKTHNFIHKDIEGKISFSDFLEMPIDWYGSPSIKSDKNINILEHWYKHCTQWIDFSLKKERLIIVFYEDLIYNPYQVYLKIKEFHFKNQKKIKVTDLNKISQPVGLLPNNADTTSWQNHFSKNDEFMFQSLLMDDVLKFRYGI